MVFENIKELKEVLKKDITHQLERNFRRPVNEASDEEIYNAVVGAVMSLIRKLREDTKKKQGAVGVKQMYYLSAEFLMGRALFNNLNNLNILPLMRDLLNDFSANLDNLEEFEPDAGLGNGGLGRLAACFLDSLATLDYPGHGYGIRYQYGMFKQKIENGFQVEYPDNWLKNGVDPWEIRRSDIAVVVEFYGTLISRYDQNGNLDYELKDSEKIIATPYDMPIVGYDTKTVNRLRLWEASSPNGFDLQLFNNMQYTEAVQKQTDAENISRVLYPNDSGSSGKMLRLKQQYFFTSASLQDIIRLFVKKEGLTFEKLPERIVIQLNDTHPVVAIPELMRILMDSYDLGWDEAWNIVIKTFAYTNHTILAEALEKWPTELFKELLPRIYQIIEEINRRFLITLNEKFPNDLKKHNDMSIISSGVIKMAWLAIVGSFSVNGVAELHTEILKTKELKLWYDLYPEKFNNKTNGVTQRRWLFTSNPLLSDFITKYTKSSNWIKDLTQLIKLKEFTENKIVLKELSDIKYKNKIELAKLLKERQGVEINPNSIFDVQIKRLHEYKRQLLNILHIMSLYNKILKDPSYDPIPRTFIFGAKAASGYKRAKEIIKLINTVADRINNDHRVRRKLKIVFIENYCVSLAEKIFPATDISEQISTAGKEASGTGNMKFMLNGALTLGTMDGANVEIVQSVGEDNAFIFGLKSEEIDNLNTQNYNPLKYLEEDNDLEKVVNQLIDGFYTTGGNISFTEIYNSLIHGVDGQRADVYYVLADFKAYAQAHEKILQIYSNKDLWAKKCLLNIASAGKFSSDRTIEEYVRDIWEIQKI